MFHLHGCGVLAVRIRIVDHGVGAGVLESHGALSILDGFEFGLWVVLLRGGQHAEKLEVGFLVPPTISTNSQAERALHIVEDDLQVACRDGLPGRVNRDLLLSDCLHDVIIAACA